jgi:hypothetical protein
MRLSLFGVVVIFFVQIRSGTHVLMEGLVSATQQTSYGGWGNYGGAGGYSSGGYGQGIWLIRKEMSQLIQVRLF